MGIQDTEQYCFGCDLSLEHCQCGDDRISAVRPTREAIQEPAKWFAKNGIYPICGEYGNYYDPKIYPLPDREK